MIDTLFWATGVAAWAVVSGLILWAVLTALCEAVDATWFTVRCWREGVMKRPGFGPLWRLWVNGFFGQLASARSSEGYYIPYPGYPWTPFDENEE